MKCVPVLIPTLNRIEHLKKCIDSLKCNKLASETELFISLDYPPQEKYVEGYKKVKEYLENGIDGFLKTHIFYQEKNLGAAGNAQFLLDMVRPDFDVFIFSEDDNEFAPCYLEYMNRCLQLYWDDDTIFSVYANRTGTVETVTDDVFKVQDFSAYACGMWFHKREKMTREMNRDYLENICCDHALLKKMEKTNPGLILACASALLRKEALYRTKDGSVPQIDMMFMIYYVAENKYMVCSEHPLVKNNGFDGSGVNCEASSQNRKITRELTTDIEVNFDIPKELNIYTMIREIHSSFFQNMKLKFQVKGAYLKIWIWRLIANRL